MTKKFCSFRCIRVWWRDSIEKSSHNLWTFFCLLWISIFSVQCLSIVLFFLFYCLTISVSRQTLLYSEDLLQQFSFYIFSNLKFIENGLSFQLSIIFIVIAKIEWTLENLREIIFNLFSHSFHHRKRSNFWWWIYFRDLERLHTKKILSTMKLLSEKREPTWRWDSHIKTEIVFFFR